MSESVAHLRDDFFQLMKECTEAAGKDLESLSKSLSALQKYLECINQSRNDKQDNSFTLELSLSFYEFARSLLELETVRTGTGASSEKRIQDLIDSCLDQCGYQTALVAAIEIIRGASKSDSRILERRSQSLHAEESFESSKSIAPVISSIHTIKRLLLTQADASKDSKGMDESWSKFHHLPQENIFNWKNTAGATFNIESFSTESAIKSFVNIIILLPTQIANACHENKIQLPIWATRDKTYSRLLECSAQMALFGNNEQELESDADGMMMKEEIMESIYFSCLLEKVVHLGSYKSASSGLFKFWNRAKSKKNAANVLKKAISRIQSTRQRASLLCCIIKHCIAEIEIYPSEMTASHSDLLSKKYCMPFLELVCLPILQASVITRDAFVQLSILAPSPTADVVEGKLLVRCVVLLLSLCSSSHEGNHGNEEDDSSSDSDCEHGEYGKFGREDDIILRHLAEVAAIWSESYFVQTTNNTQQRHVSLFILYTIDFMEKENYDANRIQQVVAQELVTGITNRLKVTDSKTRIDGMQVAEALAPILGQPLAFEELNGRREVEEKIGRSQQVNHGKMDEEVSNIQTRRKEKQVEKVVDPDEEYCSEDDSDITSPSDSEQRASFYSSDSDWGEEDLVTLDLEDDDQDLRVVAKPRYLRECLDLLRNDGDDHKAVCKLETALREVPVLVRGMPPDLIDVAVPLANELFHMENKFNLEDFTELRFHGLCSLAVCESLVTVEYLQSQIFKEISLGKRFDVIEIMKMSSFELSGQLQMEESRRARKQGASKIYSKVFGKRRLVIEGAKKGRNKSLDDVVTQETLSKLKTRRWGRGRRTIQNRIVENRFGPVAPAFFYPLVQGFLSSKSEERIWGGDKGGTLLSILVIALSTFVENSGRHPGTVVLAKDLFELSWTFIVAENNEVRLAVLIALATCLLHVSEDYLMLVICGTEDVLRVLSRIATMDTDENCRVLAASIRHSLQSSIRL